MALINLCFVALFAYLLPTTQGTLITVLAIIGLIFNFMVVAITLSE